MVSKWCPNAKKYDLLPLLWYRSGASKLRSTISCRCFGVEVVHQCYEVRFVAVALVSKWRPSAKMCHLVSKRCPSANMYDVLPLFWFRSGASVRRYTICCRCCGLEVVPQCRKVRYVAVALVSKWCPDTKKYDLLPLLWSRSGAQVVRWTICCRCFGLQLAPPQC